MTDELVHYASADGVGTITLDSPHNRNALSRRLVTELFDALDRAEEDTDGAGRGDPLRRPGLLLGRRPHRGRRPTAMEEGTRALVALQRRIVSHAKPVVVRLAGPVRAGGLGIVAAADVVLCSDDVTFAFTESRLGLAPAVISLTVVPRLTSRAASDVLPHRPHLRRRGRPPRWAWSPAASRRELDPAVTEACEELKQAHPQGLRETKALLRGLLLSRSTPTPRRSPRSAPGCSPPRVPRRP